MSRERPPTVAEAIGGLMDRLLCLVLGHVTDPCLPFCLVCGEDRE